MSNCRDTITGALLALAANSLVGLVFSNVMVLQPAYPQAVAHTSSLGEFFFSLSVYSGLALVLILGLLMFQAIWDRAKRRLAS